MIQALQEPLAMFSQKAMLCRQAEWRREMRQKAATGSAAVLRAMPT